MSSSFLRTAARGRDLASGRQAGECDAAADGLVKVLDFGLAKLSLGMDTSADGRS
jgi:hypothetical protein